MKYMFLLNRTTDALPEPGTAEFDQAMQEYGAALETLGKAGCSSIAPRWRPHPPRRRCGFETVRHS